MLPLVILDTRPMREATGFGTTSTTANEIETKTTAIESVTVGTTITIDSLDTGTLVIETLETCVIRETPETLTTVKGSAITEIPVTGTFAVLETSAIPEIATPEICAISAT